MNGVEIYFGAYMVAVLWGGHLAGSSWCIYDIIGALGRPPDIIDCLEIGDFWIHGQHII